MARKPRIHFPGAFYHVIARGNGRQDIFLEQADYHQYVNLLQEYKQRFHFTLYAYVLMTNHVHLLIEVDEVPLSRIMQNLQFRYTRKFNLKYNKDGHLFQGRYKAIVCDMDAYFLELTAYIHLNPVRAGMVDDPAKYQWSSYQEYVSLGKECLVAKDFVLSQFARRKAAARHAYEEFVAQHLNEGHREDFYLVKDQRFLGDDEFLDTIREKTAEKISLQNSIPLNKVVEITVATLGIPAQLLYSTSRGRQGAWGRSIVGYVANKLCGHQNKTIADHFGRDPSVFSKGINKVEQQINADKSFARLISKLEKKLTHV